MRRPRLPNKPLKLKGIHRVKKRQADGSIKVYLYHRATGLPLDEVRLAETYADAEILTGSLPDQKNPR